MEMKPVVSSHIKAIGYDPKEAELHVHFNDGKRSIYSNVPSHVADDVVEAGSIGRAFHHHVKGRFDHRYHEEP